MRDAVGTRMCDEECQIVHGQPGCQPIEARDSLAVMTGEAGDAAGARDLFAALVPDVQRVLGSDHSLTLSARDSLAFWTREAGDAAGALGSVRRHRNDLAFWAGDSGGSESSRPDRRT